MSRQTPEGWVKDRVKEILKEMGVFYWMPVATMYGRHGVSDFICCVHGHLIVIETKATAQDKPTKMQEQFMKDIRLNRGVALVVHPENLDSLRHVLKVMLLEGELV